MLDTFKADDDNNETIIKTSLYYDDQEIGDILKQYASPVFIISLNCQSLRSKFGDIKILVDQINALSRNKITAILLQETWVQSMESYDAFHINNYHRIGTPTHVSTHGGLLTYVHDTYSHKRLSLADPSDLWEHQFIQLTHKHTTAHKLLLGNIYRKPIENITNINTFTDEFSSMLSKVNKLKLTPYICGDLNINLLRIYEKKCYYEFFDSFMSLGFIPKISLPTRIANTTSTLIDNILVNNHHEQSIAGISTSKISDHQLIFMCEETDIKKARPVSKYIKIRKNDEKSLENFKSQLQSADLVNSIPHDPHCDPNISYNIISEEIGKSIAANLPTKLVKYNKKRHLHDPWMTHDVLEQINHKNKLYKKRLMIEKGTEKYKKIDEKFQTSEKLVKKLKLIAKRNYYFNAFNKCKHDIKNTWKTIYEITNKQRNKSKDIEKLIINNQPTDNKQEIANTFNDYFANVGNTLTNTVELRSGKAFSDYLLTPINTQFEFTTITEDNVKHIIKHLKNTHSSGWDSMTNSMIKHAANIISLPISININQILTTGTFPDKLKVSKIIPIFKKNDKAVISNYRPIALLPVISKIVEKVMQEQLTYYIEDNRLLYEHQYGFRKGHSTELAALELIDRVTSNLDKGEVPLTIFLDLSKAFDTLNHTILLSKLKHYGVTGIALSLFSNYLTQRTQYVDINGTISNHLPVTTGVPQGSILGPLLFLIYINDIQHTSNTFNVITYADDTTLVTTLECFHKSVGSSEHVINEELEKISLWMTLNKLSINSSKTKTMTFHMPQKRVVYPRLSMNGTRLDNVDSFNFLGIIINKNLSWKPHISHVAPKISKTNGVLSRLKHIVPTPILLTLYNTMILPHLQYGILSWGLCTDRLFTLQKRAIRTITNSYFIAHTYPLFKSLGILRLDDLYELSVLKFYYKLTNNLLPHYFDTFKFTHSLSSTNTLTSTDDADHSYNLRPRRLQLPRIKHAFATKCLKYQLHCIIRDTTDTILAKVNTHSIKGYSWYIKLGRINNYDPNCNLRFCYVCRILANK